jgi:hypothetical protein
MAIDKGLSIGARLPGKRRLLNEEKAEDKWAACNRFAATTQAR